MQKNGPDIHLQLEEEWTKFIWAVSGGAYEGLLQPIELEAVGVTKVL